MDDGFTSNVTDANCNPLRESSNSKERRKQIKSIEREKYVERYEEMMRNRHAESAQVMPNQMTGTISQGSMAPLRHPRDKTGVQVYASENPRILKQGARTIDYNIGINTLSH